MLWQTAQTDMVLALSQVKIVARQLHRHHAWLWRFAVCLLLWVQALSC